MGVFFGPASRFNSSGRLSPSCPQTSSRAEIEALSQANDAIRGICHGDMTLQEIKIRSDSEYLCQAMSHLKEGHEAIDEMTYGDDGGLHFRFWHVPIDKNREAAALANDMLGLCPGLSLSRTGNNLTPVATRAGKSVEFELL